MLVATLPNPLHHPFDTPLQMPDISCTACVLLCVASAMPPLVYGSDTRPPALH